MQGKLNIALLGGLFLPKPSKDITTTFIHEVCQFRHRHYYIMINAIELSISAVKHLPLGGGECQCRNNRMPTYLREMLDTELNRRRKLLKKFNIKMKG
jgi:hypothetical protein